MHNSAFCHACRLLAVTEVARKRAAGARVAAFDSAMASAATAEAALEFAAAATQYTAAVELVDRPAGTWPAAILTAVAQITQAAEGLIRIGDTPQAVEWLAGASMLLGTTHAGREEASAVRARLARAEARAATGDVGAWGKEHPVAAMVAHAAALRPLDSADETYEFGMWAADRLVRAAPFACLFALTGAGLPGH